MKLSIIIPCYKVEKYINKCLDSIFSQNVSKDLFEVIVINDGSPDRSGELAYSYTENHSNCRLINQSNGGLSVARNTGLENAKGEYVWFVDSDDWLIDGSIDYVLKKIDLNSDVDIFASTMLLHYESDGHECSESPFKRGIISGPQYFREGYQLGASQRSIYKKSFLDRFKFRFYPGILHEDGLWGQTVYYKAGAVMLLDRHIYTYLKRECGSIMSSVSIKSPQSTIKIHKMLIDFMNSEVNECDRGWYENYIMNTLWAIYTITKSIWKSSEFIDFEKENRPYIRKACFSAMKVRGGWKKAIALLLCPKLYLSLKNK